MIRSAVCRLDECACDIHGVRVARCVEYLDRRDGEWSLAQVMGLGCSATLHVYSTPSYHSHQNPTSASAFRDAFRTLHFSSYVRRTPVVFLILKHILIELARELEFFLTLVVKLVGDRAESGET